MDKSERNKRKASEAFGENNPARLDIAAALQQPSQALASTLLECLPPDATVHEAKAKNILGALDVVKKELLRRTRVLPANVALSGVTLPSEVLHHILDFLPRYNAVHKASLVSRAWLPVVRSPSFWHTLDEANGLLSKSKTVTSMRKLVQLLRRPQFKNLKSLKIPLRLSASMSKSLTPISRSCPMLQLIDLGYPGISDINLQDGDLLNLPSLFPRLSRILINQDRVTAKGIERFCQLMGIVSCPFTSKTMVAIASTNCRTSLSRS